MGNVKLYIYTRATPWLSDSPQFLREFPLRREILFSLFWFWSFQCLVFPRNKAPQRSDYLGRWFTALYPVRWCSKKKFPRNQYAKHQLQERVHTEFPHTKKKKKKKKKKKTQNVQYRNCYVDPPDKTWHEIHTGLEEHRHSLRIWKPSGRQFISPVVITSSFG